MPEHLNARRSATAQSGFACWLALLLAGMTACGAEPVKIAALLLPDATGRVAQPFVTTNKAVAFFFVSTECPIANKYAPEIQRLQKEFPAVSFWLVYPNKGESDEAVRRHVAEFQHRAPALRDPNRELVRLAKARVTPEAAVFTADGKLRYHGRIDDRHADFGKQRPQPMQRDLADALRAITHGKEPASRSVRAVGCPIQ